MTSPSFTMSPRALIAYLRAHRQVVERIAAEHGISRLRVTPTGRMLAAVPDDVTYFGVAGFEQALEDALGVQAVEVVPDEVLSQPRHSPDLDEATPL